jgi:hypothetical protein
VTREPEKPQKPSPRDDDDVGLPGLDGGVEGGLRSDDERLAETDVELDVADDAASSLDDAAAGDLDPAEDDDEDAADGGLDWDDGDGEPVDADPSLTEGDEGGWTEGSETSESDPWEPDERDDEEREIGVDRGEEGIDEHVPAGAIDDAWVIASRDADLDGDADDLDVREDASIEATGHEASALQLPRADVPTSWLGPAGEPVRAVTWAAGTVFVGAGVLLELTGDVLATVPCAVHEGEVTSVVRRGAEIVVGTDAGEVLSIARDADGALAQRGLPRPGTRDSSLGAIDAVVLDTAIVVRTRGGALFRTNVDETGWVGPIVARPVRMVRGGVGAGDGSEWLLALAGTPSDPSGDELLASPDARRFERVPLPPREPGVHLVGMARTGMTIALALSDGPVMLSPDAGATWAPSAQLRDAQQVWLTRERGSVVLYAAMFHEASDRGQLVRVTGDGEARVVLDVAHEARVRRLGGPGDPDGDGRIHDLAVDATGAETVLWVATGVGLFRVEADR